MKTIILDTNFLLIPYQFKINIMAALDKLVESAHELAVGEPVLAELKRLSKGRKKESIAARVALEIIERNKLRIIESNIRAADDWIVEYCKANPRTIVCTNDIGIRTRLKAETHSRIIVMRTRTKIFWA